MDRENRRLSPALGVAVSSRIPPQQRRGSSAFTPMVATELVWALACTRHTPEEGVITGYRRYAADLALHWSILETAAISVSLLLTGLIVLWRIRARTGPLRALRLPTSAAVLAAAAGIAPAHRIFLLADRRPYAVCIGLWRPAIYVSDGLVDSVSAKGLRAALAHEEAHRRRRDPLRLLALHAVGGATSIIGIRPLVAALADRVALRAEIHADRFASTQTSTRALAEALLEVLRHVQDLHAASPSPSAEAAGGMQLGGGTDPSAATLTDRYLGERLRFLLLPHTAPLPPLLTVGSTVLRWQANNPAIRWRTVAAGVTLLIVGVALLPVLAAIGPWPEAVICLVHG